MSSLHFVKDIQYSTYAVCLLFALESVFTS
jgi:hypothetical protein